MRAADRPSKLRVTHGTGRMYLALGCGPLATQLPDLPVGLDRRVGAGIGSSACPAADAGGRSPIEAASHSRHRPARDVLGTGVWATGNPAAGPARRPRPADRCWDRQLGMSGGRCGRPIGSRTLGFLDRSLWHGASACGLRVAGGSTRDAVTVPVGARSRSECRRAFARQRQTVCRTLGLWSRRCWHTCWRDRFWIFDT